MNSTMGSKNESGTKQIPHESVAQLLVSDQDYAMMVVIFCVLCSAISVAGFLGNALTIATYCSMKLKDGVAVSFLVLAVSDFLYIISMLAHTISLGFYVMERKSSFKIWFPFDPFGIYVFFSDIGILLYLMTILATTFIAIIRCLCVAVPLRFKNILTRKRTILCMSAFCVIAVASYTPILANMTMVSVFDSDVNATRYKLWISPHREDIKMAIWISRDVFVTFVTEIIVIVCVVIMARSLRAAAKFRTKAVKYGVSLNSLSNSQIPISSANQKSSKEVSHVKREQPGVGSKDLSVIRQVSLISTVYIICNTPKLLIDLTVMFVPDFTIGRPYQNVYLTVLGIMELFQVFNSSFNFCIYYTYNSKFRKHLCMCNPKT